MTDEELEKNQHPKSQLPWRMELHHPPVNLKVVTVIFGQALSLDFNFLAGYHAEYTVC